MQAGKSGDQFSDKPSRRASNELAVSKTSRRLVLVAVLFLVSSSLALWQFLQPYSWHKPYSWFEWLLSPLERNLDTGLPSIPVNVNAIAVSPNDRCLWIAGNAGLLAYSSDDGRSWTMLEYASGTFRVQKPNTVCASATRATPHPSSPTKQALNLDWPSFTPTVYAAGRESGESQAAAQRVSGNVAQNKPGSTSSSPLKVFPQALQFGQVTMGSHGTQTLSLTNMTEKSLVISTPAIIPVNDSTDAPIAASEFSIAKNTCTALQPKEGCTIAIDFSPKSTGRVKARLGFSEDYSNQPLDVSLDGLGIDAGKGSTSPNGAGTQNNTSAGNLNVSQDKIPDGGGKQLQWPSEPPNIVAIELEDDGVSGKLVTNDPAIYTSGNAGSSWDGKLVQDIFAQARQSTVVAGDKEVNFEVSRGAYLVRGRVGWWGSGRIGNNQRIRWSPGSRQFEIANGADTGWRSYATPSNISGNVSALWFVQNKGWATSGNQIFSTNDEGKNWQLVHSFASGTSFNTVFFQDGQTGWAAGDSGVIFHTTDGGMDWLPASRAAALYEHGLAPGQSAPNLESYSRFVAPWYLLTLLVCAALIFPAFRAGESEPKPTEEKTGAKVPSKDDDREAAAERELAIGNHPVSDKPLEPGEPDALALGKLANGLAFFLSNEKTKPPLVIAINGQWGSGKSSLMNLLKKKLESFGGHPVWFNAWHHQKEDQLLAALLQAVKSQAVPPLFAINGMGFRLRLLIKRLRRSWAYLGVATAVVILVGLAERYLQDHYPTISVWSLITYFLHITDHSGSAGSDGGPLVGPVTILTAIVAAFQAFSRLLTAFGTNPASLLSSVAGATSKRDLEAQTSFRERFATEFREVTGSLAADQRMLILIDDLDRCRPEKVREVLEAVNFLASSGDCFIVLGMAREIVEHYVGLSFRRVVDSMTWEMMGFNETDVRQIMVACAARDPIRWKPSARGVQTKEPADDAERTAKRRAFARLYLNKLVQIEVSVPEPTPMQKRMLFETEEARKKNEDLREIKVEQALVRLQRFRSLVLPVLQITLLAAALVGFGLSVGKVWLQPRMEDIAADMEKQKAPHPTDDAETLKAGLSEIAQKLNAMGQPPASKTGEGNQEVKQNGGNGSGATSTGTAGGVSAPVEHGSERIDDGRTSPQFGWLGAWQFYLALLIAVIAFSFALTRLPRQDTHDSQIFTDALNVWSPLVMTEGVRNTPRAARRFQNRVRYLAMRQRARSVHPPSSLGVDLLRRWYGVANSPAEDAIFLSRALSEEENEEIAQVREILAKGGTGETKSWKLTVTDQGVDFHPTGDAAISAREFRACVMGEINVPEQLLVAFAAIEEYDPSWIEDEKLFSDLVEQKKPGISYVSMPELLRQLQAEADWSRWKNLEQYRYAYLKLSNDIKGKDKGLARATGA